MATVTEIKDFKSYVIEKNSRRIVNQNLDQKFFEDTYEIPVPDFVDPKYILRTGFVSGLANSITQQVISYIPKVYLESKNKTNQTGTNRIASLLNKWCKSLANQTTNPFRESFKSMAFTGGEYWIYIPHNDELMMMDNWQETYPDVLPVYFMRFEPRVVFHDPSEDIDGKPQRVVVSYRRSIASIKKNYPRWIPRAETRYSKVTDLVDFWLYFDKEGRYAEADEVALFTYEDGNPVNGDGKHENLYKCLPFAHRYSGYGSDTNDKEPSLLAFSRTRMIRDKVKEDAAMATDFRYNQSELVWKIRNLYWPMDRPKPDSLLDNYSNKPGNFNILEVPPGVEPKVEEARALGADAYAYRSFVRGDLNAEHPLPTRGLSSGTSGRQEDILAAAGLAMYDSPVEATASLWAEAFEIALKICSIPILKLLPSGLSQTDVNSFSEIKVDLKKDDLVARDRMIVAGRVMVNDGQLSLRTHLIKNMGMTEEEADEEIDEILAERYMFQSPDIAAFLGAIAAQNSGMQERLQAYQAAIEGQSKSKINVGTPTGTRGGQPRTGNIQSETGMEMADTGMQSLGVRSTPMGG